MTVEIEEQTPERLVLKHDPGKAQKIAMAIGCVAIALGLLIPLIGGFTMDTMLAILLIPMGAIPVGVAGIRIARYRTEFDQAAGTVTRERQTMFGKPERAAVPLGEVLGAETKISTPKRIDKTGEGLTPSEEVRTWRDVRLRMSGRSGHAPLVVLPPLAKDTAGEMVRLIDDWLPPRQNEND